MIAFRTFLNFIIGMAMTIALAGCFAVGPSYQPPQPEMPARWGETADRVSVQADADIGTWWTLFNDATLNELINRAIASNQDLAIAETRIREARAARRLAASGGFPALGVSGAYTDIDNRQNTSNGLVRQDLFQTGFDMGWEIDLFGGIRRATEAAEANLAASVEDRRDVLVSLVAEVARNYIELRGSQQRLAITRENIVLQEQTVDMVRKRLNLGFGDELAVVQAETQLAATRAQVPGLEAAVSAAMLRIDLLLGKPPGTVEPELASPQLIPVLPPQIPVTLPSDLLRRRPDIRRAERQLAAATADIGVATAELFPHFSLSAFLGLQSVVGLSELVTSGSRFWSGGPRVNWSLFNGGKVGAGIEISESRRDRAQIVYEKTVLSALIETENALVAYSREQESLDLLKTAEAKAERALVIAKDRYRLGLVDFLNVLQGQLDYSQARDRVVQSEDRLSVDMVALFKAIGGGWQIPEEQKLAPDSKAQTNLED